MHLGQSRKSNNLGAAKQSQAGTVQNGLGFLEKFTTEKVYLRLTTILEIIILDILNLEV
jgi:hypothetical protein